MIVNSPGTVDIPAPWWVGKMSYCPKCRAVVTLQAGDTGMVVYGSTFVEVPCPTSGCSSVIRFQKQYFLPQPLIPTETAVPDEPISPT